MLIRQRACTRYYGARRKLDWVAPDFFPRLRLVMSSPDAVSPHGHSHHRSVAILLLTCSHLPNYPLKDANH